MTLAITREFSGGRWRYVVEEEASGGGGGGGEGPSWEGPYSVTAANLPSDGSALVVAEFESGAVIYDAYLSMNVLYPGGAAIGLGIAERAQSGVTFDQIGTGTFAPTASTPALSNFYKTARRLSSVVAPVFVLGSVDIIVWLDNGTLGSGDADLYLLAGTVPAG